jgi:glycerate-2-kinase
MPAPIAGVALREKQRLTRLLLHRGATIAEMNAVRKQLSQLKGGGFARLAAPAHVVTLALSDVPGDDPGVIGSGPTVEDPGAAVLARRTMARLLKGSEITPGVARALARPKPRKGRAPASLTRVIGCGRTSAVAAAKKARELGFTASLHIGGLSGEARTCGPRIVARFLASSRRGARCLIATGETVVRVFGRGRGGRNQELALSAAPALARGGRPLVLAGFATDGVDGNSSAAGGMVDDRTDAGARARGVSITEALDRNDSGTALERLGALLVTGPTRTNVADLAVLLG